MTSGRSPWADPDTPTEPGPPYMGPPVTAPPAQPPYAFGPSGPPYGAPSPYGWPPATPYGGGYPAGQIWPTAWAPGPPPVPRKPGQVITSGVLAFAQAALVLLASLYVWFAASLIGFAAGQAPGTTPSDTAQGIATEANTLAVVGLVSAVLLIVGGVAGLIRRSRAAWVLLVAAHAVQVVLAGYWAIRMYSVLGDVPGTLNEGAFASFALFFAAAPLVGLGLVLLGPGRAWFDGTAPG